MTGEPTASLRRPAELVGRPEPGDDPQLVERIREEIRADGPMTFARFMELTLYHPDHGFYASGTRGPGRSADFLTAPESHPIFGWTLARQFEDVWEQLGRPARFTIREYGAGTGTLAAGIIEGLTRSGSPLRAAIRYRIEERSPDRQRQVVERLASIAGEDAFEPDDGRPIIGAVLANEVLDALPVHRVVGGPDGSLRELFVGLDAAGSFEEREGTPSSVDLSDRLVASGVLLPVGQRAEICLAVDAWIAEAAGCLERGLMLLIDYGHPAAALYAPERGSLLRAYLNHRVHDDPFRNVGRQDLTAHVDLTAVQRAASASGLDHLGTTTQAEFLAGLGTGDLLVRLQTEPGADLAGYLAARSAVFRLLDPLATGRFAVMLFGRGLPDESPLRGLQLRLARDR